MKERVDFIGSNLALNSHAAYEAWHQRLAVDSDIDTPWHRLVRAHLQGERDLEGKRILEIGCGVRRK
jgi:hypothetical protein